MPQSFFAAFLFLIALFVLLRICYIIMSKDVCDFFGHNWESISKDTIYYKDTNKTKNWETYQCKNCKKKKKVTYYD